jgi:hypothetical protein
MDEGTKDILQRQRSSSYKPQDHVQDDASASNFDSKQSAGTSWAPL